MEQDKNKKDSATKLVAQRVNKALEKFHEYLGAPFEKLVPSGNSDNLYKLYIKDTWHIIKIEEEKNNIYIPIDLAGNTTAYSSLILFSCIKNTIENEDKDRRDKIGTEFWFAGLPFNFHVEGFIDNYLGKTSAIRLKEILDLIGINATTYNSCFSVRTAEFNDDDLPELIADIFNKKDSDTLTVNHVRVALGIDHNYLIDYVKDGSNKQFIITDNGKKMHFQKSTK